MSKDEPELEITKIKEDEYCAVCHDGGGTLYCCDRCPKVYHPLCYVPNILDEPPDVWVCALCVTKQEMHKLPNQSHKDGGNLGIRDLQICRTLLLGMFTLWPTSENFHNIHALAFDEYREIVKEPVALDYIKERLDVHNSDLQYATTEEYFDDVRRMFRNCNRFWKNVIGGRKYSKDAKQLEEYFESHLKEWAHLLSIKVEAKPIAELEFNTIEKSRSSDSSKDLDHSNQKDRQFRTNSSRFSKKKINYAED